MRKEFEAYAEELKKVNSVQMYNQIIDKLKNELKKLGLSKEADQAGQELSIVENRFSRQATQAELERSIQKALFYLENDPQEEKWSGAEDVLKRLLGHFHIFCKRLYMDPIHGKCSESIKEHLSCISIENEYDLQHLMYAVVCACFPAARIEEVEDSGHHTIRKDIVLDEENIAIELKCTRKNMSERDLSEEIASDMIHYSNQSVFFYIYDKENIIQSPENFKRSYEAHQVDKKHIYLQIHQVDLRL